VRNEISKGNFVSILLLRSNSIISGQFKNIFIKSSDVSLIFLHNKSIILSIIIYLPLKSITELLLSLTASSAISYYFFLQLVNKLKIIIFN